MGYAVNEYCYPDAQAAITAFNSVTTRWFSFDQGAAEVHAKSPDSFGVPLYLETYTTQGPKAERLTGDYIPTCPTEGPLNSIVYGIDWTVVEWIFGAGLVMFATGAAVGSVINIVRKARL